MKIDLNKQRPDSLCYISVFFQCNDPCDLPYMQYNFVSIGDLNNCNGDDIVGKIDLNLLSYFQGAS